MTVLCSLQYSGKPRLWRKVASQAPKESKKAIAEKTKKSLFDELKACTSTKNLQRGTEIHAEAAARGNAFLAFLAPAIVHMYTKCGRMADARLVFDAMRNPNVVSWTALISGYAANGEGATGLEMFTKMRSQGCAPNCFTFVAVLKANISLALNQKESQRAECLETGKRVHSEIGSESDIFVENTLIDMYAKCGSMADARQVFDRIQYPDVVSWNTIILGYAENGNGVAALDLFARMTKSRGCVPDRITFVAALKACTVLADANGTAECLQHGRQIHSQITCHSDIHVKSSLIHMYAKCGSMVDARRVFDSVKEPNVVSWNTLILGYAKNGEGVTALDLYAKMKYQGCSPTCVTFVAVLKACTSFSLDRAECLLRVRQIHSEIECPLHMTVQNTLIDVYAKLGTMAEARQVFESIEHADVVSWNNLILGYAENGEGVTALDMLSRIRSRGCAPDSITFVAALKACSLLGSLESGRKIHSEITELSCTILVTCLVDFYAKCGCLVEAQKVFDSQPGTRDLKTWTALLAGYSRLGEVEPVFELFERMQDAGFQPDCVTFACILTCCSHAGLVEKASKTFEDMPRVYRVAPTVEHYTCMVDILGRSNKLDNAMALLQSMPCSPDAVTWMTVLAASRKWKSVGIGRLAFESLVSLDESDAAVYVLMAHIYGSKGMWEEQQVMLGMSRKLSWRTSEQSCWTSEDGEVSTFVVTQDDREHCTVVQ